MHGARPVKKVPSLNRTTAGSKIAWTKEKILRAVTKIFMQGNERMCVVDKKGSMPAAGMDP